MTPYSVHTLTRRELRNCYNRYAFAVMLFFPASYLCARVLFWGAGVLAPQRWLTTPEQMHPVFSLINAIASYVPTAVILVLFLRCFPQGEKMEVDRLSLWELIQAAVFSLGLCFLFNILTLGLVHLLSQVADLPTTNRIVEDVSNESLWEQIVFTVATPAVCEELLFRKLLLNRLRPLGDVSAVFLSALAFSIFHANLYQLFYTFVLGVLFAVVALLTGSVRDTILLHMIVNGSTVLFDNLDVPWFTVCYPLFLCFCAIVSVVQLTRTWKHLHFEPGPAPLSSRDKRRSCLGSVWFWVMLLEGLAASTCLIFL